jgi:hypothetical protein
LLHGWHDPRPPGFELFGSGDVLPGWYLGHAVLAP